MMVGGRFREEAKSILQHVRQSRQEWEKQHAAQVRTCVFAGRGVGP